MAIESSLPLLGVHLVLHLPGLSLMAQAVDPAPDESRRATTLLKQENALQFYNG